MFSFIVIVVGTNAYPQSDKSREIHEDTTGNLTDKMKFLCLYIDANGEIDQIEDKEQQAQCEKFLDKASIFEMKELIEKYNREVEDD
jgi:uncharacterized protein YlbG (UPF0298 family)